MILDPATRAHAWSSCGHWIRGSFRNILCVFVLTGGRIDSLRPNGTPLNAIAGVIELTMAIYGRGEGDRIYGDTVEA